MQLLKHQEKYAKGYKDKELVCHEFGLGKTICAAVWLKDGRDTDALVVCPKRVVKKWQDTLTQWGTKATVLSKEQFKKTAIKKWSALVIDEADEFASPLFTKQRSQLSTVLYYLVKTHDCPTLLLTATPIRSNPWNLHTLLCFIGQYIDHKRWRDEFFTLERRPYLPRPAWIPKSNWRTLIRPYLEKHADIVLLKDCVSELPPVTEEIIKVNCPPFTKSSEWEPTKAFVEEHRNEQKEKVGAIKEIGKEFRKVLVVAHYVEQLEQLSKDLSGERETFMIHGGIKNQEEIIKKAQASDECYFCVQASLGVGWDADSFSCVIFASMGYAVRDYVQLKARVKRIHNLHSVFYYYLHAGRCDKAVYNNVMAGRDFVPSEYMQDAS